MSIKKPGLMCIILLYLSLSCAPVLAEKHHADSLSFKTIQVTDNIWLSIVYNSLMSTAK